MYVSILWCFFDYDALQRIHFLSLGAAVQMTDSEITVNETSGTVEICAILVLSDGMSLERNVGVEFITAENEGSKLSREISIYRI